MATKYDTSSKVCTDCNKMCKNCFNKTTKKSRPKICFKCEESKDSKKFRKRSYVDKNYVKLATTRIGTESL